MSSSLREVLDDLAAYLRHCAEEGRPSFELDADAACLIKPWLSGRRCAVAGAKRASAPAHAAADSGDAPAQLRAIAAEIESCSKCPLHSTRTRTVPGQGPSACELMFIGEGPGEEEDREGLPFVGAAGQLLTRMIEAMGLNRGQVFIANIVKCRPPHNRVPLPDEMAACLPFLHRQIRAIRPRVMVTLGATATRGLLGIEAGITHVRGRWQQWEGIPVMPTFHPSYLLRSPSQKKYAWEDLKEVLRLLGKPIPSAGGPGAGSNGPA